MRPLDDGTDWFAPRHIEPSPDQRDAMLQAVGTGSLDTLIDEVIPSSIRLTRPLNLPPAESEHQYLRRLSEIASRNQVFRSYIGLGYHDTITPSVILRMVMENPGWYTPYTPYQAEIAQGRLESLVNFQTMIADLTGMEIANASLLDEATAAAEAMTLLHRVRTQKDAPRERARFLVSDTCLPQTIDVVRGRAEPLGIEVRVVAVGDMTFDATGGPAPFGVLLQYPDASGLATDLAPLIARAHAAEVLVFALRRGKIQRTRQSNRGWDHLVDERVERAGADRLQHRVALVWGGPDVTGRKPVGAVVERAHQPSRP